MSTKKWQELVKQCAGKIDSYIELLQGKFSKGIMESITHKKTGLFPSSSEITLNCSCPDSAQLCKHIAAALYGVGARLDEKPEEIFLLRQVDHADLIQAAETTNKLTSKTVKNKSKIIANTDLSSLFGIEINESNVDQAKIDKPKVSKSKSPALKAKIAKPTIIKKTKAKTKTSLQMKDKKIKAFKGK